MVHRLYHTHTVIPGQRYDSFLNEVVAFLKAHPTEIVIIRTCSDGIKECEIPSASVITSFAQNALSGSGIQLGAKDCFPKSVSYLRSTNTRLILVQNNSKYDSYSDGAYETLNPSTIIDRFKGMKTGGQAGNDFTVLQCQVRSNLTRIGHLLLTDLLPFRERRKASLVFSSMPPPLPTGRPLPSCRRNPAST